MKTVACLVLAAGMSWHSAKADDSPDPDKRFGYVVVQGEDPLEKPVILECKPGLSVMSALMATDIHSFNPPRKVSLLRDGQVIIVDLKKLRTHPDADLELKPRDVLQLLGSFY